MWIARLKSLKNARRATYNDIADACGVSRSMVSRWFNGDAMPDPGYIDIMHDKFFGGLYSADRLEALFSYAYEEKHNVDGQIGICEVNEEHMEILNAKITGTKLTMRDHGCLSFWIFLEGAGWGVGYGGYCIGHGYLGADEFSVINGDGLEAMMRIMDVVGVDTWEDLNDKFVRVKMDGWGKQVHIIGNIMKDKWFDIKEFFEAKRGGNEENNAE